MVVQSIFEKIIEELDPELLEAIKRKRVIRGGKKVTKRVTDREGYKMIDGKEVRMSAQERRKRKKGARRSSKKRIVKKNQISRKRNKSLKRRKSMGL